MQKGSIPGGTDLERGYGDVRPWRPPFHASPVVRKGPISSKIVSSQDPLLRQFENFSLYSLNFSAHKPQILDIFSSQATQICKFTVHKPRLSEASISSQAPHLGNPGRTHPHPEKKLSAPPRSIVDFFCIYKRLTKVTKFSPWKRKLKTQNSTQI